MGVKGETIIPKAVRQALDVGPGDRIAYAVHRGHVVLSAAKKAPPDPFATFEKWSSEADMAGYASL